MSLIEIKTATKDYLLGKTVIPALKGISFRIERGEFLSVVGPSGCGKTTLLNLIGCIDKPTSGTVLFQGENTNSLSDNQEADLRLKNIGFIFQSFNLVPVLNIFENIELPMILNKIAKGERKNRAVELIEMVGLSEFVKHKPEELSGGQRQRVAIARALVNRPELVIADEPTANLDSKTGDAILDVMQKLNEQEQTTFIFATHNPEVMRYAKKIVHLKDGLITDIKEAEGTL